MNWIKYLLIRITHWPLCKLGYHRLITWNPFPDDDKQCWCGEMYGGIWTR